MRIIVTGDRNWYAHDLAEQVLKRLILRYGPGLIIVHDGPTASTARSTRPAATWASSRRPTRPAGKTRTTQKR
jgi:hypothetical protein